MRSEKSPLCGEVHLGLRSLRPPPVEGDVGGRKVQGAQARVMEATPGEERDLVDQEDSTNRRRKNRRVEDPIDNEIHDPNGPGELGKPFKVENPDRETKAAIDKGWQVTARIQLKTSHTAVAASDKL